MQACKYPTNLEAPFAAAAGAVAAVAAEVTGAGATRCERVAGRAGSTIISIFMGRSKM